MHGYVCFFDGKRWETHADSLYAAKLKALEHFKPPKRRQHMVHVVLAEIDGKPITHTPTE